MWSDSGVANLPAHPRVGSSDWCGEWQPSEARSVLKGNDGGGGAESDRKVVAFGPRERAAAVTRPFRLRDERAL
jgi:hypothetical protein